MNKQKLLGLLRKTCDERGMIKDGDRIAVGLSGGKDSLALVTLLRLFQNFSPKRFELAAFTVDLGFKGGDFIPLIEYCKQIDVELNIIPSNIAEVVFEIRKEKNPCSLCSNLRRGILNSHIAERGFNKLALGHHADDLIETFLLSLFYEGRLSTFQPISYMSRADITLIRPLICIWEKDLANFSKDLPIMKNPCCVNGRTEREHMKNIIKELSEKHIATSKESMFTALIHPERNNLWEVLEISIDRIKE